MINSNYRSRFPVLAKKTHLANCTQAPLSNDVADAIDSYVASVQREGVAWEIWMEKIEDARCQFADVIGAGAAEVSVGSNVSSAMAAVASCSPIKSRRLVISTAHEFPAINQVLFTSHGLDLQIIRSQSGRYDGDVVEPYLRRNPAMLCVHAVSYYSGMSQPIQELAEACHSYGALLLVDAYQALGAVPFDVKESQADIVISGALKYLLGIPGIAFMYVREGLDLSPVTGWLGKAEPFAVATRKGRYACGAWRFDSGTPPVVNAYAAAAGMRLVKEVGIQSIREHTLSLAMLARDEAERRGLQIATPDDPSQQGPFIAIRVGSRAEQIEHALAERDILVAARQDVVRIAPGFFSEPSEICMAIEELASCIRAQDLPEVPPSWLSKRAVQVAPYEREVDSLKIRRG